MNIDITNKTTISNISGTYVVVKNSYNEPMIAIPSDFQVVKDIKDALEGIKTKSFFKNNQGAYTEHSQPHILSSVYGIIEKEYDPSHLDYDKASRYMVTICGGQNGWGRWENYFEVLSKITASLKHKFFSVTLFSMHNDICDDIWYADFIVRYPEENDYKWDDEQQEYLYYKEETKTWELKEKEPLPSLYDTLRQRKARGDTSHMYYTLPHELYDRSEPRNEELRFFATEFKLNRNLKEVICYIKPEAQTKLSELKTLNDLSEFEHDEISPDEKETDNWKNIFIVPGFPYRYRVNATKAFDESNDHLRNIFGHKLVHFELILEEDYLMKDKTTDNDEEDRVPSNKDEKEEEKQSIIDSLPVPVVIEPVPESIWDSIPEVAPEAILPESDPSEAIPEPILMPTPKLIPEPVPEPRLF